MKRFDVVIVGGGIGGLVAGALLAEGGARVLLLEQQAYAGGCCASFSRGHFLFETGATVGCGFHRGGPMHWLGERLKTSWPIEPIIDGWAYQDEAVKVVLTGDREPLIAAYPASQAFWKEQAAIAEKLWKLTEMLLGQYGQSRARQLSTIVRQALPKLLSPQMLQLAFASTELWLRKHRLDLHAGFRRFLDAQLLVSAQTTSDTANGLFSGLALDLPRKNPCRIRGGMKSISEMLITAITDHGGEVHLRERAVKIDRYGNRIDQVATTRDKYACRHLICNGTDAMLADLLGLPVSPNWAERNRARWGAFVLYLGLNQDLLANHGCRYLQLVGPDTTSLGECGSLFLSTANGYDSHQPAVNGPAISISTHTKTKPWWQALRHGRNFYDDRKHRYVEKILATTRSYLGDVDSHIKLCMAATPVTYHRYTGRPQGLVGGYAQSGWLPARQHRYGLRNLSYVGDHCFPGQSLAGVTVGATLVADQLGRRL
jgi:phytoene dehydrogenase-like protein